METPANLMTPSIFSENVKSKLACANVDVQVHDEAWAKEKKMNSFLSVTNGTKEAAKFLEITYKGEGSDDKCIALVGKGVTFDSGGISLKPSASMDQMRADMGGAANVAATIFALAQLKAPVFVKGLLIENTFILERNLTINLQVLSHFVKTCPVGPPPNRGMSFLP